MEIPPTVRKEESEYLERVVVDVGILSACGRHALVAVNTVKSKLERMRL